MKINIDAQMCLKKLEYVGVLNFATVGLDGSPQDVYKRQGLRFLHKSGLHPGTILFSFGADGKPGVV